MRPLADLAEGSGDRELKTQNHNAEPANPENLILERREPHEPRTPSKLVNIRYIIRTTENAPEIAPVENLRTVFEL